MCPLVKDGMEVFKSEISVCRVLEEEKSASLSDDQI